MVEMIQGILQGSLLCRLLSAAGDWLGSQWKQSVIVQAFLSPMQGEERVQSSVFYRLWLRIHGVLCAVFSALRLDRLLEGSLFRKSWLWCMIAAVLAPIAPTVPVAGLTALGCVSFFLDVSCDRRKKLIYTPLNRYLLLFAAIYLFATFTSVTVRGSLMGGLLTVLFVLFAWVLVNAVTTRRQLDLLTAAMVLAGAVVALYGIYQYVSNAASTSSWIDNRLFEGITTRVYATLQNPNVLSEYLLLVIPFAAAGMLGAKTLRTRLLYLGAFSVMCICMVLTFSRGGWLGLLLAGAVFLVLLNPKFIWLGIIGMVGLALMMPATVINRFTSIGNMADGSTYYRVSIWLATIAMLKDYWFCGIGPGTTAFNMVFPAYSYAASSAQHAHNLFLQLICDSGICGILSFAAALFVFFRASLGTLCRETKQENRYGIIAPVSAVCGFLVQSMTDNSFYNYRVMLLFWTVLGLGAAFVHCTETEKEATR